MTAEVRRPLYRGSQPVRALWLDCSHQPEDAVRQRVLQHWEPGARAYRVRDGYLLEWSQPRRLVCEQQDGLPLCDQDGVLASAPLLPQERAGILPGQAVLVQGAALHVYELSARFRIDPSRWLDLSAIALRVPLALPVRQTAGFQAALPEAPADVRALLGDAIPPPSAKRAEFLKRAAEARDGGTGRSFLQGLGVAALGAAALAGAGVGWLGLLSLRLFGAGSAAQAGQSRAPSRSAPSPLRGWIAQGLNKLAMMTRLSSALGWRQASYLRKMLDQFEKGDLAEALRHAIPLDSPKPSGRRSLGVPGRRDTLDITGGGSAAEIGMDVGTTSHLRAVYRRSFDALDRAGRIDEAVFVLAELLNCGAEAVDYLERKGRLRQAAQLAETLELAPALQVRLHFLAGDVQRAILLARLHACFAEVLAELERRKHAAAGPLRLHWAEELAARGQPAEAALVIWPLKSERQRALTWLQLAAQAGGSLGVQALVYRLALDPAGLAECNAAVQALLSETGEEAAQLRVRAASCVAALDTHSPATARLAAELWRVLMAERMTDRNGMTRDELNKLLTLAADPVLQADQPVIKLHEAARTQPVARRSSALQVQFAERGLQALQSVRRLPDGGYLLALGDAGLMQTRSDGRQVAFFPVPVQHLVVADNGQQVLALARRERVVRVSRIDLVTRKMADWFSAPLDFWAPQFDGGSWNVVAGGRVMALDAMAAGQSVLWQIGDLPGHIIDFVEQDELQAILLQLDDETVEHWRYALPQRRLLQRDQFRVDPRAAFVLANPASPQPWELGLREKQDGEQVLTLRLRGPDRIAELGGATGNPEIVWHQGLFGWGEMTAEGWRVKMANVEGRLLLDILLPEARQAAVAIQDGHLLTWDACGRLVDVDLHTSAVRTLAFS